MNRNLGAAVVAALSIAVTGCTTGQPPLGGSALPSAPVPSPAASSMPAPTSIGPTPATPPPSATASPAVPSIPDGPLAVGTYRIPQWDTGCSEHQPGCSPSLPHDAVRVTLTVPDGWAGVAGTVWLAEKGNGAPDGAGLLLGRGAWLLSDPCTKAEHEIPADVEVGPSVDDFANAIADHPLLKATDPVDVTLAGYSGKYLELRVPADISKCEVYRPWDPGIFAQGPRHRWHIWIIDVNGLRFVVQSTDYPGTSAKHRSELEAIVDSITFEP